jgi:hypothetical protein
MMQWFSRMGAIISYIFRPVLVNQPRKSMETRVDINELKNACLILNTAEYCQRTTEEVRIHRSPQVVELTSSNSLKVGSRKS